ncbi:MAG: 16S rRNA (cytosine(967)-C(5))-methyltransferase RsmB [Deltaproteobacteria bacterium]|nr:16S rRNA (cytosine(967)-C(5))-methyltransferase RsmB [Candidatus Anaeroferrophillacea bacterium]
MSAIDPAPGVGDRALRQEVWNTIIAWEKSPRAIDELINQRFTRPPLAAADARVRARFTGMVSGIVRYRRRLDHYIDRLQRQPRKLPLQVLTSLRLALFELEFLQGRPDYAVVSEAVRLAKKLIPGREGFVNALLRNFLRQPSPDALLPPAESLKPADFAVRHSLPDWIAARWLTDYGYQTAALLAERANDFSGTTLRVNPLRGTRDELLGGSPPPGIDPADLAATEYAPAGIRCRQTAAIIDSSWFTDGLVSIQDEAAQLVGHLVDSRPGGLILDACAAPGGKSAHLAELAANEATIIAVDRDDKRRRLIDETARRLGLSNIISRTADLTTPLPADLPRAFDAVLVDAPCSGLGVLRRRADLRWRRRPEDVDSLATLQLQILTNCSTYVRPGGRLVYATCTACRRENQGVIADFLTRQRNFSLLPPERLTPAWPAPLLNPAGELETFRFPEAGMDGFFAVVLHRHDH